MATVIFKKSAALTRQKNIKLDPELDKDVRFVEAMGVDVCEEVRVFLRRKMPVFKKKLSQPA